jgi:hypothetical protein
MKLFIMQVSRTSCRHFISVRSRYSPSSQTPSVCVPHLMSETKFNIQQQKIIVLYILIFMLLYSRREDKKFWTEW